MENYYTTNDFNQEVLTKEAINYSTLLTLALYDVNRLEKAIKTTYCKKESSEIINKLNIIMSVFN